MTFYITNALYQHFIIKKELPLLKTDKAKNHIFVSVIGICIAIIVSVLVPSSANAIIAWIIDAVGSALISILLIVILSLIFDRKTFFNTVRYIKVLTGR